MGVYAGVEKTWASQTNVGRTHIATKGIVQSGLVLNLDAGVLSSYPNTSAELITNGTFDSNVNGWTTSNSTNTWSSGKMQIARSGGDGRVSYQTFTTIAGQSYRVSAEVNSSGSRGDIYIYDGSGIGGTRYLNIFGTNGQTLTLTGTFTAISTITTLGFGVDANGTSIIVDNVSVSPLWTDLSGNGNNGTLTNGPTYSSANGGSIVFDGTNDYVKFGSSIQPSNLTMSIWIKPNTSILSGGYKAIVDKSSSWYLFLFDGVPRFFINGDANYVQSSITLTNNWFNVVGTYNQSSILMYVNGSLVGTTNYNVAISNNSNSIELMSRSVVEGKSNNYKSSGDVSQVSIYNRALSATEISQNFNATKSRYGL